MHPFRTLAIGLALVLVAPVGALNAATLDPEVLDRGSDIAYRRALAPVANDRRLNADAVAITRVRRIANRLVASAGSIDAEAKRYAWAVNLVPGAAPDVRVYPGGRVIVNDGLVNSAGLGDEEIAAILAHAFAHSLLGHDGWRVAAAVSTSEESADPNRRALDVAEATANAIRAPRYTAAEISAADRASIEMLARAAYDPRAAGSAWRRLALGGKGIVERTPVNEERLLALDASIRAAVPLYEETRAKAEASAKQQRPPRISGPSKDGPPFR
jgi:Zn-dependent protease with chaperone function